MNEIKKNNSVNSTKLQWACRRGMLELDVLLGNFLQEAYPALSSDQQAWFIALLECDDPALFAWLMGTEKPESIELQSIVEKIRLHARSRV